MSDTRKTVWKELGDQLANNLLIFLGSNLNKEEDLLEEFPDISEIGDTDKIELLDLAKKIPKEEDSTNKAVLVHEFISVLTKSQEKNLKTFQNNNANLIKDLNKSMAENTDWNKKEEKQKPTVAAIKENNKKEEEISIEMKLTNDFIEIANNYLFMDAMGILTGWRTHKEDLWTLKEMVDNYHYANTPESFEKFSNALNDFITKKLSKGRLYDALVLGEGRLVNKLPLTKKMETELEPPKNLLDRITNVNEAKKNALDLARHLSKEIIVTHNDEMKNIIDNLKKESTALIKNLESRKIKIAEKEEFIREFVKLVEPSLNSLKDQKHLHSPGLFDSNSIISPKGVLNPQITGPLENIKKALNIVETPAETKKDRLDS